MFQESVCEERGISMNLEIKSNGMCGLSVFRINGIDADTDDFGESYDSDAGNRPDYGCGNRTFRYIESTESVLAKYGITKSEYDEICDELSVELYIGQCARCA